MRSTSETGRPKVDVGVVTWNTAELTVAALRNLVDQDQGCELRILVHDNGSCDGTVDAIAEHVPEADVERGKENLGFSRAMNSLLFRSEASWFFALNSDAWPEPGTIANLVETAKRYPRAAAVAPLLLRPDSSVEHSTHPFPSPTVALIDAVGGRRWMPKRQLERLCLEGAWGHERPRTVDWAVGAALLIRKTAIEELGGFDERFFMYVEDLEWCWRAKRGGWEIRFEPAAVVRHVGNASGQRRWGESRAALEAQNLRMLLPEMLGGPRAAGYRILQSVACAERFWLARRGGKTEDARYWKRQLKANLRLEEPPPLQEDPVDECQGVSYQEHVPGVAVVVPTRGRADRLSRLVHALEAQTLPRDSFEVVVVDDASNDDTLEVLEKLSSDADLDLTILQSSIRRGPAAARNLGWRAARAPVVAFTDDDCVPDPNWLRAGSTLMERGERVVVGHSTPPPDQAALVGEPFARYVEVSSARFFETCNVFYRRADLEAVDGFDERFHRPSGEDTHLGLRVTALGAKAVFAPDALVHHDVRAGTLTEALSETLRWVDLPLVLKDRPWARRGRAHAFIFWRATHPPLLLAVAGAILALRRRPAALLALPWIYRRLRRDPVCRDPLMRIAFLPGALLVDLCEVAVMARGSLRHRTVLL